MSLSQLIQFPPLQLFVFEEDPHFSDARNALYRCKRPTTATPVHAGANVYTVAAWGLTQPVNLRFQVVEQPVKGLLQNVRRQEASIPVNTSFLPPWLALYNLAAGASTVVIPVNAQAAICEMVEIVERKTYTNGDAAAAKGILMQHYHMVFFRFSPCRRPTPNRQQNNTVTPVVGLRQSA